MDIQLFGFIRNFGFKILDSGRKSLKNPTSGQAQELQTIRVTVVTSFEDNNIMKSTLEYLDEVMEILESFGYPDMVVYFAPEDVARSIAMTCSAMKIFGQSPMMCAIMIWSLTLNMQLLNSKVVH